ncbi:hypothetical protein ASG73_15175 [Janibacter sp. Soil728]|nr:hypothetical protein ASG73_15175 [Janibacter sp. Soil728]
MIGEEKILCDLDDQRFVTAQFIGAGQRESWRVVASSSHAYVAELAALRVGHVAHRTVMVSTLVSLLGP